MTFSIVARDPATGAFGVATATGGPVVGSLVPHARAGVGALATQGYTTNGLYAFDGLDLLAGGQSAQIVLDIMTDADAGRERRQCVLVDRSGGTAAWSGTEVSQYRGALLETGIAVAGNLLAGPEVLAAMMEGYRTANGDFADRLLAALEQGNAAGGDRRGAKSAALKVYTTEPYPAIDLRVDWSTDPIGDLAPILAQIRGPDYGPFFSRVPTRADPGSA